ncbi:aminopeptidase P family protein [Pacificimonas sp. WHA3]|uniref:Aminopeptidase P family protein n=1 Tax=Pacificimonas pallii TaxID=2827236 RepID=A0ABS6SFS4_9SPHN|nr:aminopeptidase P family protein [Pacificimonas pallii]MBV7257254.1 aminopeptidase P family protein [Pacificimonas pallii]
MSIYSSRLEALRTELSNRQLDGFVIPLTDEHMSEYVGDYALRLQWLTGFQGSAGTAAVLPGMAAIFTDGRYKVQVRDQVDGALYSYQDVPAVQPADWLEAEASKGMRIGYDAWLATKTWARATETRLKAKGISLTPADGNPIDAIWPDQPAPSAAPLSVHEDEFAGQSGAEKRAQIADWLKSETADAVVIAALDSVAWTLNIRGSDVSHTPVALAFAVVRSDGTATLFVEPGKVTPEVRAHMGADVDVAPRDGFAAALEQMGKDGLTVALDPSSCVAAIFQLLAAAGAKIIERRDPALLPKAVKNDTELEGSRAAHIRDGGAVTRFLKWIEETAPGGELDELGAAAKLHDIRRESNLLRDLSFDTISAAGPNAALPHYRVSEESNRKIALNSIFLCDSGGQYTDGTTDVTRTVVVGTPTDEMKERFTRVLKGHIALATQTFPKGTRGTQLDSLARMHLWRGGVDYGHGTGHGVGSFLAVHEGPQRISAANYPGAGADEPLRAGMILSNEPGYYKEGEYGIRIENLVIVEPREIDGAEGEYLGFETITFAPIDLNLVAAEMLTSEERDWLNGYHDDVRAKITPELKNAEDQAWLANATRAI